MICWRACAPARSMSRDEAATAVERFFRKPNLMALRELALRRVADRVEAAARASADRIARAHALRRRSRAGGRRPGRAGRAARARRQAHGRCARCRMDRGVRRDPGAAAPVGGRAQPAHRRAAAGRVAGRRDRHARRAVGRRGARWNMRRPATPRASSSARRSGAAGARGCGPRPPPSWCGARAASMS